MTPEDWLSLLAQVATWFTVLLVLFTFFEMIRQRKSTYRPDIVVSRSMVYGHFNESLLPDIWMSKDIEPGKLETDFAQSRRYRLRAHNLGLGAAREVDFKWSMDLKKIVNAIYDREAASEESTDISLDENEILRFELGSTLNMWINTKVDLIHSADYILPASVESSGHELPLPLSYIELMSYQMMQEARGRRNKDDDSSKPMPAFQPLSLKVRYRDIGGSKHSKEFQIQPSIIYIKYGEMVAGDQMFSALLEIQ